MATVDDFLSVPSEEPFEQFSKDQLLRLPAYYDVKITSSEKGLKEGNKDVLTSFLTENGILEPAPPPAPGPSPLHQISAAAIELRLKELDLQRLQLEGNDKERLLKEKQMHLELKHAALRSSTNVELSEFDAVRHIGLVPPFVEKHFPHFEGVATVSKCPQSAWTLMFQRVLLGKAQEAYSALSIDKSGD